MSRPVVVPIEDALDLHAFVPREIPSVVESYLEAALEAGFREVRLIHGRGRGVQRRRVHEGPGREPAGRALRRRAARARRVGRDDRLARGRAGGVSASARVR